MHHRRGATDLSVKGYQTSLQKMSRFTFNIYVMTETGRVDNSNPQLFVCVILIQTCDRNMCYLEPTYLILFLNSELLSRIAT